MATAIQQSDITIYNDALALLLETLDGEILSDTQTGDKDT